MAKETRACTIGKPIDGGYEVLAGFVGGFTTPQTVLDLPEPLATGQTLRGEGTLANGRFHVSRLRSLAPDEAEAKEVDAFRARLISLKLPDPVSGPSLVALQAEYKRRPWNEPVDVKQWSITLLCQSARRFPTLDWREDIEPALDDFQELLTSLSLSVPIDGLRAQGNAALDASRSELAARLDFCRLLMTALNDALTTRGDAHRYVEFAPPSFEDKNEPLWLYLPPGAADALVQDKTLKYRKQR